MNGQFPKRVLIADHKQRRARAIANTLKRGWRADVCTTTSRAEAYTAAAEASRNDQPFDVIMVAFGLEHRAILRELCSKAGVEGYLIVERDTVPLPSDIPVKGILVASESVAVDDTHLVERLLAVVGGRWHEAPRMSNARRLRTALRFLVESLDPDGELVRGTNVVGDLVMQLLPQVGRYTLHPLGQGFSGAKVFRVSYNDPDNTGAVVDRVLKLTASERHQFYKCEHELRSYRELREALTDPVVSMIPEIFGAGEDEHGNPQPAYSGKWSAVMYAFLGGSRLETADFEQAYLYPDLDQHALAGVDAVELPRFFLDKLLPCLSEWYSRNARVESRALWSANDAAETGPLVFPPYRFRRWEKGRIIAAIHELDQYGRSLGRGWWSDARRSALGCMPVDRPCPAEMDRLVKRRRVLLSPVHGDLNANNVLLALRRGVPLLIDFACYQPHGHTLQDFARLEVAIKIELMGRETSGAPVGKDLNSDQFSGWRAAEDWLSRWPAEAAPLPAEVERQVYLSRAYMLCRYVRQRAMEVHGQVPSPDRPAPNFRFSYNAALLYHTLRAIRYETLPRLKRLFAVYSVSNIISQLRTR